MTRLSDTQLLILSAAAQRNDGNVLPLPGSLRGGAATKVVGALLTRELIAERATDTMTNAAHAQNGIWRYDEDGRAILLHIAAAGLAAIGVEGEDTSQGGDTGGQGATEALKPGARTKIAAGPNTPPQGPTRTRKARDAGKGATDAATATRTPRQGTKQARVIAMLRGTEGATIAEIAGATGWQQHTVRGMLAGALKKKLGLDVTSDKVEGRGRVYRIV